jgi:ribonuclease BN (tRNA processing enzyme)
MLNFIGIGSAFNTKLGNTCAFMRRQNSMILVDCGGTVFHRLRELKLLEGLQQLHIIITHTHPDHVGSLGEVIYFLHYTLKVVPKLYFPDKELMGIFLKCIGVQPKMLEMVSNLEVQINDLELGYWYLSFLPVSHSPTIPAFGFILENEDSRIYYSGDANAIPESVKRLLKESRLDIMYQDTCELDYAGNAHLSFRKLCKTIPENLRSKVCCIHLDSFLDINKVKAKGFQVANEYQVK